MNTNITFEYENEDKTSVLMKRDGETIGRIWSQHGDGKHDTPYPHDQSEYCLNSVQICGFDRISEIWGCGPFTGKKDCVIHFRPDSLEYYVTKKKEYRKYVENFLNKKENDVSSMQSFDDWVKHHI